ncbi:PREDICTED: alpha-1B-glycoprotein [Bison bison bison]|uniref:Alpha-1B-glycoprotein n=1 Tax=Bison bison bison TaxID=43346 RepID=A0A6P3IZ09_BISBB|nr:PREDICTED: alpha-1B-glycoprotein [Bison bison bison]
MSAWAALLLLWGLSLSPVTEQAPFFDPRPSLWAEAGSPLAPWADVTLTCQSPLPTQEFQLLKDGVGQEPVHLESPAHEHRFPLGPVTSTTRGLYRCSYKGNNDWISPSNLVEVTGAEPLPPPSISTSPVSWITPGLNTTLLCLSGLRGVTFLLRLEGEDQFLEVAEAPEATQATFPVHRAGNYSCSYRTHAAGTPSEPSATVTIEELDPPPAPTLTVDRESAQVLRPGSSASLTCVAPLSGVDFQLRRGAEEQLVPRDRTRPARCGERRNVRVRRGPGRVGRKAPGWSQPASREGARRIFLGEDPVCAPASRALPAGTLPAPELSAEPAILSPTPGALVQLRCRAPRAGVRFALVRKDAGGRQVQRVLSPAGPEAQFELRGVSAVDSGNYSCVYVDTSPPFAGSKPSATLELRVDGPLPRPQLRALWTGALTPGRDAVLRCEAEVSVGPQHAGTYSCRYRTGGPRSLLSELSDPVELRVAGELKPQEEGVAIQVFAPTEADPVADSGADVPSAQPSQVWEAAEAPDLLDWMGGGSEAAFCSSLPGSAATRWRCGAVSRAKAGSPTPQPKAAGGEGSSLLFPTVPEPDPSWTTDRP